MQVLVYRIVYKAHYNSLIQNAFIKYVKQLHKYAFIYRYYFITNYVIY